MTNNKPGSPEPGRYQHFKGGLYQVLDLVRHSETEEWLVLYRALYGEQGLWVRPLALFCSDADYQGKKVPRFVRVE